MKVRVAYTVDIDDDIRRAINAWYGRPGLASRKEIQRWYEANGESMDADLAEMARNESEYETEPEQRRPRSET